MIIFVLISRVLQARRGFLERAISALGLDLLIGLCGTCDLAYVVRCVAMRWPKWWQGCFRVSESAWWDRLGQVCLSFAFASDSLFENQALMGTG